MTTTNLALTFDIQPTGTHYTKSNGEVYRKDPSGNWVRLDNPREPLYASWELDLLEPINYLTGAFS